jgi:hypothetical protein
MNTPNAQPPINKAIFEVIYDLCWELVEVDPEFKKVKERHVHVVNAIYKSLGSNVGTTVENTPVEYARLIGTAMFKMGLEIGRNPESVLTLPDSKYPLQVTTGNLA